MALLNKVDYLEFLLPPLLKNLKALYKNKTPKIY